MKRYTIKDIVSLPHEGPVAVYKDQIAVINALFDDRQWSGQLFAIDSFAIGYTTHGYALFEFNNTEYRLEPGSVFILAPTHSCRMIKSVDKYSVRMLLLDSNGHNISVHLNYLVKSERWTQTYFNPVLKMSNEETARMNVCLDRITEQLDRTDAPNFLPLLRLATTWHHVELDNIMQIHLDQITDSNMPLTRKQTLARHLYRIIVSNYRKEHQVRFYSEQMCLTPQYLNQITTEIFGKTLTSIISDLLFSTGRAMILSSEMSIQQIADELNFPDLASFSKFIKKHAGVSPNALRKTNPHKLLT